MTLLELFAIAVALAVDAFAVAVCAGCAIRTLKVQHYAKLGLTFGFFQFFMPVMGWYMGLTVRAFIENWDHWVAFALLAWVGLAMIREAWQGEACSTKDPTQGRQLLVLAIATSIDALAVGFSFSLLHLPIWEPAIIIGLVCTVLTALGLLLGKTLAQANVFGQRASFVGGIVLLAIGVRILYEHKVFD